MCSIPQSVFPSLLCLMYVIPAFVETLGCTVYCMSTNLAVSVFTSCSFLHTNLREGFHSCGALTVHTWSLKFSGFWCAQSLFNDLIKWNWVAPGNKIASRILPKFSAEFQWPQWNLAAPSFFSQSSVCWSTLRCFILGGNEQTCLLKGVKTYR